MGGRVPTKVLKNTRVLIASRPRASSTSTRLLRRCAKRGILRVADFDDLLFTSNVEDFPTVLSGLESQSRASARALRHRRVIDKFDAFTVSTPSLASELQKLAPGAPVIVVPNGLSAAWVARANAIYPAWKPGDPRVIRYLPGSTHDADFTVVGPALRRFLNAHPEVTLEVVGRLKWDRTGFPVGRVHHHDMVPYEHLPRFLASSWVNIAPLVDNRFNRCKSAIKFLEAAAFACPTVATPIPSMEEHRGAGLLFARTEDEWFEGLGRFRDDDFRVDQGEVARTHVLSLCCASSSVRELAKGIESLIAGNERQ